MSVKLIVAGAGGRMGTRITALAAQDKQFELIYGLESPGKSLQAPMPIGNDLAQLKNAAVVIDFSVPEATTGLLKEVLKAKKAIVIGTTGFTAAQDQEIADAAREIPIVKSYNMSLGVNVFFKVAQEISKALPQYSVHIQETHHVHKKDAPSGTALQAGRLIEQASGVKPTYESFREGEVIGDHRIVFKGPADHLELYHHAESRDLFASGALRAASWVVSQKPGLYTMQHVLGL